MRFGSTLPPLYNRLRQKNTLSMHSELDSMEEIEDREISMNRTDSLFSSYTDAVDLYKALKERLGLSSQNERTIPHVPTSILPVPAGILNPANLFNDAYGDRPPLAWPNLELHDKIAWIGEQVPMRIDLWFATRSSSPETSFIGPTMAHITVEDHVDAIGSADVDCLNLWLNPDLVVHMLRRAADPAYVPIQIAPYPGYEARNPAGANPIGPPLAKQPWAGRTLYQDMAPSEYPVGHVFPAENGDKFTKVMYVSSPGQGPFGTGGKNSTAWERTYKG